MPTRELPRSLRTWVGATTISQAGDAVLYFALGWAASGFGGTAAGIVLAAIVVPRTVLMLVGGAITDRVGPRVVLLVADALLLVASVAAALLVLAVGTPFALLVAVAVVLGTVTSFHFPAAGSLPALLVDPAHLPRALALRSAGVQLASLVGGPLGGLVVAAGGLALVLGINAASFVLVLVVVLLLRPAAPPAPAARRPLHREMGDGLRVAAREPALRVVLSLYAVAGGFALPLASLLIPLLGREHGWPVQTVGLIEGAISAGAMGGALVLARTGTLRRAGLGAGAGLLLAAAGAAVLALGPAAPTAAVAGACAGIGLAVFIAHASPLLVTTSPPTHVARVQALLGVVQSVALVGTNLLLGAVARAVGSAGALLVAAAGLLLAAALAAGHPALRAPRPTARSAR